MTETNFIPAPCGSAWYRPGVHDELADHHRHEHQHHGHDGHHEHDHADLGGGDVPTTSLLREARGAYALAIRAVLDEHGIGDVPPNSAFLLGGLRAGIPFEALARQRRRAIDRSGVVEALVEADCVRRLDDDVVLTDRGRAVAAACAAARDTLDRHVVATIGSEGFGTMRAGLVALIDWKEQEEARS
jgi:hypothetical protein